MTDQKLDPVLPVEEEIVTFWDIARQQYRKNAPAMVALWCVVALVLLATAAPLISLNIPYLMQTPDGLKWPLFDHLFNRLIFPSGVDVFFNLLLIVGPVWWLGSRAIRASGLEGRLDRRGLVANGVPTVLLLGLCVWLSIQGRPSMGIQLPPTSKKAVYLWLLVPVVAGLGFLVFQAWRSRGTEFSAARAIRLQTLICLAGTAAVTVILTVVTWPAWESWGIAKAVVLGILLPLWGLAAGALAAARNRKWLVLLASLLVVLVAFYVLLAVKSNQEERPSVYIWLVVAALTGLGWLAFHSARAAGMLPRQVRRMRVHARFGLLGIFMTGFVLTLSTFKYTAPVIVYRTEIAKLKDSGEGWAVKPPLFNHPDNKGEENELVNGRILKPPSWERRTILGTDNNGRDVFARILYGTRISLTIGIIAASIYVTIGTIVGSLAGFLGGRVDLTILFVIQVMLCIPTMFLLLTIVAVFESRSIFLIMIAIGVVRWTGIARLVRGEFMRQRSIDYVTAARALGIPQHKIMFGHILKNAMSPVLVATAFGIAAAILLESGLAFIGLGDTNVPSWGQLLTEGRVHGKNWLIWSPGMAIFFVVTVLNMVGDGLRDALDPKLRQ